MKTLQIVCLLGIITLGYTACKKDKMPEKTNQEKIIGKWNYISQANETTIPPNPTKTTTKPGKPGDYWSFAADGKIYYVMNASAEKSLGYNFNSDTEISISGEGAFTISELGETRMILRRTDEESNNRYSTTITLTR
ncbi:hypothetical protein [Pedobacter miscanthi]|uniref:Lipocalin-like domain-containing protein n=1 Tax=Pedobacter miscanthi TaxID=2259170 RepID=A0A366L8Z7_9SPHI|nr:hypothetical protein [Pedobacter miscanthi]RBQ09949.1 hypothetical protein DRW42_05775 [Pedobacter miscanthi]